jgi:trans-2-enoyl-CoA reductase
MAKAEGVSRSAFRKSRRGLRLAGAGSMTEKEQASMASWGQASKAEVSKTKSSSSPGGEDWEEASETWTSEERHDHRSSSATIGSDFGAVDTRGDASGAILGGVMTSTAFCNFLFALMICDGTGY